MSSSEAVALRKPDAFGPAMEGLTDEAHWIVAHLGSGGEDGQTGRDLATLLRR